MRNLRALATLAALLMISGCETSTWDGYGGYRAPPGPYAAPPYPPTYRQSPLYPPSGQPGDGRDGYRGGEEGRPKSDGRGYTPYGGVPSYRSGGYPPAYRPPEYGEGGIRRDESGRYYPPPSPYDGLSPYTEGGRQDDRSGDDSRAEPLLLDRWRQRDTPAYRSDAAPPEGSGEPYRAPPAAEPDRLQPDLGGPTWR